MKIVMSFWSRPALARSPELRNFKGGWNHPMLHWCSWVWAAHLARLSYGMVELVTDAAGKALLVDELGIEATQVSVVLDALSVAPALKSYGKIYACGNQEEPFLHIDSDVYLWERFPSEILTRAVIAESCDSSPSPHFRTVYELPWRALRSSMCVMPSCSKYVSDGRALRCGTFGGHDLESIQHFVSAARELVEHPANRAGWISLYSGGLNQMWAFDRVVERVLAHCALAERNLVAFPLFKGDLVEVERRAEELQYTHMLGFKRRDAPVAMHALIENVKSTLPQSFARIKELVL